MTTKTKIIDGESFEISQPYEVGHVLTEAEAKALNQLRSENIGNNMRKAVKEAKEKGDTSGLAAAVASYDSTYTFAMGGGGSSTRKLDPYEREAQKIAKELLKTKLAQTGRKLTDVPQDKTKEEWDQIVQDKVDEIAVMDNVVKAAKKAVDSRKKSSDELLASLGEDQLG